MLHSAIRSRLKHSASPNPHHVSGPLVKNSSVRRKDHVFNQFSLRHTQISLFAERWILPLLAPLHVNGSMPDILLAQLPQLLQPALVENGTWRNALMIAQLSIQTPLLVITQLLQLLETRLIQQLHQLPVIKPKLAQLLESAYGTSIKVKLGLQLMPIKIHA